MINPPGRKVTLAERGGDKNAVNDARTNNTNLNNQTYFMKLGILDVMLSNRAEAQLNNTAIFGPITIQFSHTKQQFQH